MCRRAEEITATNGRRLRIEGLEERRLLAPMVAGTWPSLGGGTLEAGSTSLAIDFTVAVVGGRMPLNYRLQNLGPDARLGTADDMLVPLAASYSGTRATLSFPPLTESVYRVTVCDTLTDASGNALDGDGDGAPGGDWVVETAAVGAEAGMFVAAGAYPSGQYFTVRTVVHADFNGDGAMDLAAANPAGNVAMSLGDGHGGFFLAGTFPSGGGNPYAIASGDFNADGKTDLAVCNNYSNNLGVLLGNGAGGFTSAATYACGGSMPISVAVSDFNGDARADVAVANYGSNTVAILLGFGSGGLGSAVTYASGGTSPTALATGDFNADGKSDIAVTNATSTGTVGILLGNGSGGLGTAVAYGSGGASPYGLSVADFNADGKSDLAVTNSATSGANLGVLLGNGTGGFATAVTCSSGGSSAYGVTCGDFNADGKADVAVANSAGSSSVGVLLGNGTGGFAAVVSYASGGYATFSVTSSDFNGDGTADLAVANMASGTLGVLLGSGAGVFAAGVAYGLGGSTPNSITSADFNGDGNADLAVANSASNDIGVLLGSGLGNFAAAAAYACGGSSPWSVVSGDFNADGKADVAVSNSGSTSNNVGVLLGDGAGGFAAAVTYPSGGTTPYGMAAADFNADAKLDLAVANSASNTVGVLLGNGSGGFATAVTYGCGGTNPYGVAAGDFNADGTADLAVPNYGSANIGVLPGDGFGGFALAVTVGSGGANPYGVGVGDWNADGKADLVVANYGANSVGVLQGNGAGGFSAAVTYASAGASPRGVSVSDFNADGKADVAVANSASSADNVSVLQGDGTGGLAAATSYAAGGARSYGLAAGDFNGDGRTDIAAANGAGNNLGILLNNGPFGLAAAPVYTSGPSPKAIAVADLNADGKNDLVVANSGENKVGVLLGTGSGGFASVVTYATGGYSPRAVAVGDFNVDGKLDIAAANYASANVGVLLGTGSGGFGAASTFSTSGMYPCSMTAADLNLDGRTDLAVACSASNVVAILYSKAIGVFAAAAVISTGGYSPFGVTAADFNADGRPDLAVAHSLSNNIGVLLGTTSGFATAVTYGSGGGSPSTLTAGDFNADSKLDVAVVNANDANVGILLGNGSGGFSTVVSYDLGGAWCEWLAAGDFNADGKTDLVAANHVKSNLGILFGNGAGAFSSPGGMSFAGSNPYCLAAADFNADGKTDLAVGAFSGSTVVVLINAAQHQPSVCNLESPGGLRFGVQARGFGAGQLVEGSGNAFDGTGRLEVAGQTFAPTQPADFLADGGRTVHTPTAIIAGLYVAREVTVPSAGNEDFARTVDVFANPTHSSITTTVRIAGNLGSGASTTVWNTSDGDDVLEPTDRWIGTDDAIAASGVPAIIHVIHGPQGLLPTSVVRTGDNIEWTYQITLEAGQTVRLAHFTIVATARADAEAEANALVTAESFGGQAAAFLTPQELGTIANFVYNGAPTAAAGGPYAVGEGGSVPLDATGTTDPDQPAASLVYQWDLDGDGVYGETGLAAARGDELGQRPVYSAASLDGPLAVTVRLRVTDSGGLTAMDMAVVAIGNRAPLANADNFTTAEDTPLTVPLPGGVLGNDSDPGNDRLVVSEVDTAGTVGTLGWNSDGSFSYVPALDFHGTDGFAYTISDGQGGTATAHATILVTPVSDVTGRFLFYNNSPFDGNSPTANSQDYAALAPPPPILGHGHPGEQDEPGKPLGKQALLPGQTASFVNYSSYAKGINGIFLAFDDLPDPAGISAADFLFRVGNDDSPAGWAAAPAAATIRIEENVVHANFPGQPDVVTLIWADENPYTPAREAGAVSNQWLQVTVLANAHTGLVADDVFYFGNQIGESGNAPSDTNVDQNDEIGARNHPHTAFNPALISDPYDFNRDGKVDQNDEILARNNPATAFTRIQLITAPSMLQAMDLLVGDQVGGRLTLDALAPIAQEAIWRWAEMGLDANQLRTLQQTQIMVASFRGTQLGEASTGKIWLDDDAAGFGWFIDPTPAQDEEFLFVSSHRSEATPVNLAVGKMDLLTAVMHEMGHGLGRYCCCGAGICPPDQMFDGTRCARTIIPSEL